MKEYIKQIQDPEIPLRNRLFQLLSTIALTEYAIVTIYQIVLGTDLLHILTMVIGTVAFAVTVTFTFRTGHMRIGSVVSALLYFLIYPLTYFSSGGMYGGAPVVYAFALVYVFLVTGNWERIVSLAVCVAGTAACYLASYFKPEFLVRHSVTEEHIESFLAIMLVTLLLCLLFAFVTGVYTAENQIVQKQKKKIEDLNSAQKRFFSSMSHEIRTPVNAIIGLNEMTLKSDISDEVRENSENIEAASRTLLHTVNEILDMSRLESGSVKIVEADYKVASMLSEVVAMMWLQAQEKHLEFKSEVDPDMPSVLRGDEPSIREILLNVLANAVKYTKCGSVSLTVGGREEGDGFMLVLEVADTGIGIREESIPYLFTSFQRVDDQNTHAIEGTGLGLAIVRQLLELMKGTVEVTSEYGKGTCFHIEIPQGIADRSPLGDIDPRKHVPVENTEVKGSEKAAERKDEEAAEAKDAEETADIKPADISGVKILAVDDTPMNLLVVKKLLRDTGAIVTTAVSGDEALALTAENHYDVILMDHQMPGMDGIECLHRIRSQENGKCTDSQVICLTAGVGSDMDKEYKKEGFDGYLVKPVRGSTLEKEIAKHALNP